MHFPCKLITFPTSHTAKKRFHPDKFHYLEHANSSQWFSKVKSLCGLKSKTTSLPCTSHLPNEAVILLLSAKLSLLNTNLLPVYLPSPATLTVVQEAEIVARI